MFIKSNVTKVYKEKQLEGKVLNAKPEELTLMLYEALVKNLLIAKNHLDSKSNQFTIVNEKLIKSQEIIYTLKNTLDFKYEISKNLNMLYDYLLDVIIDTNLNKDSKNLENAINISLELKNTWKEAINQ